MTIAGGRVASSTTTRGASVAAAITGAGAGEAVTVSPTGGVARGVGAGVAPLPPPPAFGAVGAVGIGVASPCLEEGATVPPSDSAEEGRAVLSAADDG